MPRTIPRIMIAGTHSGSGKTSLAVGIVSALRARGLKARAFKVGPDYLDPSWLAAASGSPCYNLDGWMCGRDYVEQLFFRSARDADIAVIEGVMGLFDGANPSGLEGSSAETAQWLGAPVILVVNSHGMSGSMAPLVSGFAGFNKDIHICGVIANQCGSDRHRDILHESLNASGLPGLFGAVPRMGLPELPSRHLGLVAAGEEEGRTNEALNRFAAAAQQYLDLEGIVRAARSAPPLFAGSFCVSDMAWSKDRPINIAVARDKAFYFYYQDLFDELKERGCRITYFSPLNDSSLPDDADALYLGGGYPEEFAEALSCNRDMLDSIQGFARSGRPVYGECGGLMYLSGGVTDIKGKRYPLLGVIPSETQMLGRRKRLGYVEVELRQDSLWGRAGDRLRGHEFHYSELTPDFVARDGWSHAYDLKPRRGEAKGTEGLYHHPLRVLASYVHLHHASRPKAIDHFIDLCKGARDEITR